MLSTTYKNMNIPAMKSEFYNPVNKILFVFYYIYKPQG